MLNTTFIPILDDTAVDQIKFASPYVGITLFFPSSTRIK